MVARHLLLRAWRVLLGRHRTQCYPSLIHASSLIPCSTAFQSALSTTRTSSRAPTSFFSPTRSRSTFFCFFALSGISRQRTESYALKYVSQGQLRCCNVLRHISQAFSTDYFPRSRQIQLYKHLSLRGIRVPEPTSRLLLDREETNANGRTKWWQTSKT